MTGQSIGQRASFAMVLTAALIFAAPANAASFTVNVTPLSNLGPCTSHDIRQSTPIAAVSSACTGNPLGTSAGTARADFGSLGARAEGNQVNPFQTIPADHAASATHTDIVIFSSDDPTRTFVDVALDIRVDGVTRLTNDDNGNQSGPSFTGDVVIHQSLFRFGFGKNDGSIGGFSIVSGEVVSLGRTDALLRTGLVRVGVNVPVHIGLSLGVRSGHVGSSGFSDFLNSFEIPTNRPAFLLPDGVTANSGTWLVNNRRVVAGVPEPGSWAMLIAGFGAIGVMRRRRSRAVSLLA